MEPQKNLLLLVVIVITFAAMSQRSQKADVAEPTAAAAPAPAAVAPGSATTPSPTAATAALPASPGTSHAGATPGGARAIVVPESRMVAVSSLDNASARLSSSERDFIAAAAEAVLFEAHTGELAVTRASDPSLTEYASAFAAQRHGAYDELAAFAEMQRIRLPLTVSGDRRERIDALSALSGRELDRRLADAMGSAQQQRTIALFEAASGSVRNPTLKAWVDKTLPALRIQLAEARALHTPALAEQKPALIALLR